MMVKRDSEGPFKGFEVTSNDIETGEVVIAVDTSFFTNHKLEGHLLEKLRKILDENQNLGSIVFEGRK
jgi:hypothetical protein